jgi:hypothetical protein
MKNGRSLYNAEPSAWSRVAGRVALLVGVLPLLLLAFAWPASQLAPRDLPVVVAGPPPAAEQVSQRLAEQQPGAFDITVVADETAARTAVLGREAYGAVVLAPEGPPTVLVASAASPAVAQLLGQAAQSFTPDGTAAPAPGATVEDVAPSPDDDPRGIAFAAGSLPLALGGMVIGYVLALSVAGTWRRLVGALSASVLAAPVLVAVLHGWFGALAGDPVVETAAVALGLAATSLTVLGLHALMGAPGLALGAVVVVLLGNPLSGANGAPELLPTGWGVLGQLLPPGALVSLLRSVSGFDGAGATGPVLALSAWALLGLAMVLLARRGPARDAGPVGATGPVEAPASTRPVPLSAD